MPARCETCQKTTWSGCGQHVDQVMRAVPAGERCTCTAADRSPRSGWFQRLLGR
ncbi:hypothetical protein [Euzebya sp.]|uniref:hypothetical protein n=1 Tax=Euzebya sp. TaxID=1971409 RepID=UPI00355A8021